MWRRGKWSQRPLQHRPDRRPGNGWPAVEKTSARSNSSVAFAETSSRPSLVSAQNQYEPRSLILKDFDALPVCFRIFPRLSDDPPEKGDGFHSRPRFLLLSSKAEMCFFFDRDWDSTPGPGLRGPAQCPPVGVTGGFSLQVCFFPAKRRKAWRWCPHVSSSVCSASGVSRWLWSVLGTLWHDSRGRDPWLTVHPPHTHTHPYTPCQTVTDTLILHIRMVKCRSEVSGLQIKRLSPFTCSSTHGHTHLKAW